jgi:O-antigen ligase
VVLSAREAMDRVLLRVVDGGLAGAIFLVPLLMGGRHPLGQLALTVVAVAAAWAWAVRQSLRKDAGWRPAVVTPLLLLGAALVALQVAALPPWLLVQLAPRAADLLPLWRAAGQAPGWLGRWPCISLTPAETVGGLVIFLDYAMLFLVAVQRSRNVEDVERLLRCCAVSAVIMASFGIVQLLAGNGKFFWFYEHPFSSAVDGAKGSFTNRNHFAQFLALGVGPLIWWLQDAMRRRRGSAGAAPVYLLSLALGIVLFAGLLSLSRGGIASLLLATAVSAAICWHAASLGRRFIGVLAAAGSLIVVSLAIFGYDGVSHRLEDFSAGSLERLDRAASRRTIWATAVKMIGDYPSLGAGVGSFRAVYPAYTGSPADEGVEFTHAENSYLQNAAETGLAGLAMTMTGMALCASWCLGGIRQAAPTRLRVCAAAVAGSLAAAAAHGLVDFVWYVPGCVVMVAVLAACALRTRQMAREEGRGRSDEIRNPKSEIRRFQTAKISKSSLLSPVPSPFTLRCTWAAAAILLTCLGTWMIAERIGPAVAQTYWDEYLIACRAAEAQPAAEHDQSAEAEVQRQRIALLENVVRWQDTHALAHLALAESHCRLFEALQGRSENPMNLAHVCDAAMQSRFASRAALEEWLQRAVGDHWRHLDQALGHVRTALKLCPLEGRAYVYLAQLSFLAGADAARKHAYLEQALRVRPFDGSVLYAATTEAILAGDRPRWLDYLKRAHASGPRQQEQVLRSLVGGWPDDGLSALVDDILGELRPDLQSVRMLYALCAPRCAAEQLAPLAKYRAQRAELEASRLAGSQAADLWSEAQQFHSQLGADEAALRCIGNALRCDPASYRAHYQSVPCLLKQGMFAEAESETRWCLQRTRDAPRLADLLRAAIKGRLDGQRRAAVEKGNPRL